MVLYCGSFFRRGGAKKRGCPLGDKELKIIGKRKSYLIVTLYERAENLCYGLFSLHQLFGFRWY
jgi:hypothetical protein